LGPQTELLEHARVVLRQGDPTLALRSIERYRHEFPNGAFFEEAVVLQATALCRLGRYEEGRALLKRLETSSRNQGFARARGLCDHP
jgi:outer membrane protein assembly factor BamD (BamD/ComL family)